MILTSNELTKYTMVRIKGIILRLFFLNYRSGDIPFAIIYIHKYF